MRPLPSPVDSEREQARNDVPAGPPQQLVVVADYCTHAYGSDCERCVHACPHGAISLSEGAAPVVDHDACNGCGVCFGICDAFAPTRITINELHARIRRTAMLGERVYLSCSENVTPGTDVAANVVVLPCLSMVPPELWTLMLAENIRITISCDLKNCEACPRAGDVGGALFPHAVHLAEERTDRKILFSLRVPHKDPAKEGSLDDPKGRRSLFTDLASEVGEIATGKRRLKNSQVLQDIYERRERQRASERLNLAEDSIVDSLSHKAHARRIVFPRQKMILEAVDRLPESAERIEVALSVTDQDLCTLSGACMDSCPTGARAIDGDRVEVDPRLCVGCGICVDACDQGACSVIETDATCYLPYLSR